VGTEPLPGVVVKQATARVRRVSISGTLAPLFIAADDKVGELFFDGLRRRQ
jgi:hypothetical protein